MKKVLLVAFIAGLAMTSCKKAYTCECTVTTYVNGTANTTTTSGTTDKMKKADAKTKCEGSNMTTGDNTNGSKISCAIK